MENSVKGLGFWGRGARFQCVLLALSCSSGSQLSELHSDLACNFVGIYTTTGNTESLIQTGHQLINAVLNGAVHCPDH